MLVLASHAFALIALTVGATWDLMTTEVPDSISIAVIVAGLTAHSAHAYMTGSLDPILWALGVGAAFSLYGWGMYFTGSWGGADAFAISALGFAAPYSFSGPGLYHAVDLFINIMLLGLLYAITFSIYRALRTDGVFTKVVDEIREEKLRFAGEITLATVASVLLGTYLVIDTLFYFIALISMVLLYRFLLSVEEEIMTRDVEASELDPGDVIVEGGKDSKIKGVTEDEIQQMEGIKTVKTGIRFVPVFPLALFFTDMGLLGLKILITLFS